MVLISNTNIIVDDFTYGKRNPLKPFIYFLTHMHADHYHGMTTNWNYGTVYCSKVTKLLLLNKFPNVAEVIALEMDTPHIIYLNQSKSISVEVHLFDANHCPGAVMILFRGFMGTILHTGDMRFHMGMIIDNGILYPPERRTEDFARCSIPVDELIFDNTFCDPIFKFPNREKVLEDIKGIIEKHKGKRILIAIDSLGKEELLVELAKHFQTLIVVNDVRYRNIVTIDFNKELFTTDRKQGWIEIIRKDEREARLNDKSEECISITATGWANVGIYQSPDKKSFILPYSLHSNFEEIETFVRSIHPCILSCVVRNNNKAEKIYKLREFSSYMMSLMHLKQRGYDFFKLNYTDPEALSAEYRIMMDPNLQKKVMIELGLTLTEEQQMEFNKLEFQNKHRNVFEAKKRTLTRGAKFDSPAERELYTLDSLGFFRAEKKQEDSKYDSSEDVAQNEAKSQGEHESCLQKGQEADPSRHEKHSAKEIIIVSSDKTSTTGVESITESEYNRNHAATRFSEKTRVSSDLGKGAVPTASETLDKGKKPGRNLKSSASLVVKGSSEASSHHQQHQQSILNFARPRGDLKRKAREIEVPKHECTPASEINRQKQAEILKTCPSEGLNEPKKSNSPDTEPTETSSINILNEYVSKDRLKLYKDKEIIDILNSFMSRDPGEESGS